MSDPRCHRVILLPMVRECLQTSSAVSRYVPSQPDENVQHMVPDRYQYIDISILGVLFIVSILEFLDLTVPRSEGMVHHVQLFHT